MAFLEVKQQLLSEIEALGFPRARAVRALHNTGNVSSEVAINWIIDHESDPDIDRMPLVAVNIDIEPSEPFHITEDMKRKAKELRNQMRQEKEEEEEKSERQREKDRIHSGKELQEAKRIAEETERKRYIDSRQAEKREEKNAREKVLQKLEQDKIERKRNLGMTSERLATKPTATGTGEKDEFNPQNSLPAISVGIAVSMRECLRSLKHHRKDDSEKVRKAFQTLFIYVRNVAKKPDEEKFRKIRLSNPLFQERVGSLKGGIEFLELCGFQRKGEFLYLPRDKVDPRVLFTAGSLLESALTNPFFGILQSV
ncbi:UBX domain-containing protein 1-like isoform X2 [Momordica charantia]|nr:UBX domain-containing protein 1-like isoform X2 [Momordica charantia]